MNKKKVKQNYKLSILNLEIKKNIKKLNFKYINKN